MKTSNYWLAVADRAVRTAAQTALLTMGADQLNVVQVDWLDVGGFALGGAVLSILTSLVTGGLNGGDVSAVESVNK